jgi:DNA-binding MarR family transcriptional regulator
MAAPISPSYQFAISLNTAYETFISTLYFHLSERGYEDIQSTHNTTLHYLSGGAITITELAEHLRLTKQAASLIVIYLEEHGYVTREPHPQDGRSKMVRLTPKGEGCVQTTEALLAELSDQWTAHLGTGWMRDFMKALDQFIGVAKP